MTMKKIPNNLNRIIKESIHNVLNEAYATAPRADLKRQQTAKASTDMFDNYGRLTEKDLHKIVKESVDRVVFEIQEGKIVNHKPYFKKPNYPKLMAQPGDTALARDNSEEERAKAAKHNSRAANQEYTDGLYHTDKGFDPLRAREAAVKRAKEKGYDLSDCSYTIQNLRKKWPSSHMTINRYGHPDK